MEGLPQGPHLFKAQMMQEALAMARLGLERGELPIGAIVTKGAEVLSRAFTQEKTEGRYLVHADFLALHSADLLRLSLDERRQMTLYVTLEPCLMCFGAALSSFIGEIVYALESPGDGAISRVVPHWTPDPHFPAYRLPVITSGICREESRELFRAYVDSCSGDGLRNWALSLANL
jgi:tRNA(adenine34) deaminase